MGQQDCSVERAILAAVADPQAGMLALSRLRCEESLAEFTREAWHVIEPQTTLEWNWHLDVLCAYTQAFYDGRIRRLIFNVPPGSLKSIIFSVMGPAWIWTRRPHERMINITNEMKLAKRDTRRMRDIIESDWYRARWGDKVQIAKDQDETLHFETTEKGFRQGLGMRAGITGKRGSKLGIDDPVDAKLWANAQALATANEAYDQAVSSRLNDQRADGIGLIQQRLAVADLSGHLLAKKATKWTHVKIATEYTGVPGYDPVADLGPEFARLKDPRREIGELMDPRRFGPAEVAAAKEDLGEYGWAAQHQQDPRALAGGILKPARWRIWPSDQPLPKIVHAFLSWDTASTGEDVKQSAYSAATCWGVWWDETDVPKDRDPKSKEPAGRHKLLLLGAWWGRVEWPELLDKARELEQAKLKHPQDAHLIEIKSTGISLRQTLRRRMKVRVLGYDPKADGGGDKIARAIGVQDLLASGMIWAPDRPWAQQVIDLVGQFGPGAGALSKDVTDTCTQAWSYLRNGWWIHHPDDDEPPAETLPVGDDLDDEDQAPHRAGGVYG